MAEPRFRLRVDRLELQMPNSKCQCQLIVWDAPALKFEPDLEPSTPQDRVPPAYTEIQFPEPGGPPYNGRLILIPAGEAVTTPPDPSNWLIEAVNPDGTPSLDVLEFRLVDLGEIFGNATPNDNWTPTLSDGIPTPCDTYARFQFRLQQGADPNAGKWLKDQFGIRVRWPGTAPEEEAATCVVKVRIRWPQDAPPVVDDIDSATAVTPHVPAMISVASVVPPEANSIGGGMPIPGGQLLQAAPDCNVNLGLMVGTGLGMEIPEIAYWRENYSNNGFVSAPESRLDMLKFCSEGVKYKHFGELAHEVEVEQVDGHTLAIVEAAVKRQAWIRKTLKANAQSAWAKIDNVNLAPVVSFPSSDAVFPYDLPDKQELFRLSKAADNESNRKKIKELQARLSTTCYSGTFALDYAARFLRLGIWRLTDDYETMPQQGVGNPCGDQWAGSFQWRPRIRGCMYAWRASFGIPANSEFISYQQWKLQGSTWVDDNHRDARGRLNNPVANLSQMGGAIGIDNGQRLGTDRYTVNGKKFLCWVDSPGTSEDNLEPLRGTPPVPQDIGVVKEVTKSSQYKEGAIGFTRNGRRFVNNGETVVLGGRITVEVELEKGKLCLYQPEFAIEVTYGGVWLDDNASGCIRYSGREQSTYGRGHLCLESVDRNGESVWGHTQDRRAYRWFEIFGSHKVLDQKFLVDHPLPRA